jgi:hypothetical protein
VSLRRRLRRAEKALEVDWIAVPQPDGSVKRFHPDALVEAMTSSWSRMRASLDGEPLPEPHPLLEALYNASEKTVGELSEVHGVGLVGFVAGEEAVVRGDVERPGPEVTWNGGVCE